MNVSIKYMHTESQCHAYVEEIKSALYHAPNLTARSRLAPVLGKVPGATWNTRTHEVTDSDTATCSINTKVGGEIIEVVSDDTRRDITGKPGENSDPFL